MRRSALISLTALALLAAGCAGTRYQTVRVPPRVDLSQHEIIAVLQFDTDDAEELAELTTRRFADLARRDQGLVRMKYVDDRAGRHADFRQLGERHGARTLLVGSLELSDVRPNVSLSKTLRSGSLTADVEAILTVDLIETESGASIWSASARAKRTLGHVSVFNGKDIAFDADDPESAYGELVDALVAKTTSDFRARYVRQPVPN
jgi:TolB-like protein